MEHLCVPFRRQHSGSRESLSDANKSGLISEAHKSPSNTIALHARATRRHFAREDSGHLSQTFRICRERI